MTEDSLKGHINFLSKLAKRNKKLPRLKLFTTNYDLCFEKASSLLDYVVVDGFSYTSERAYNPTLFKYDMVRREKMLKIMESILLVLYIYTKFMVQSIGDIRDIK